MYSHPDRKAKRSIPEKRRGEVGVFSDGRAEGIDERVRRMRADFQEGREGGNGRQ